MSVRDDLKAYLDGELPPTRMAEVREAIERDPALAREARELADLSVSIKAVAPQPAATGLDQTLAALQRRSTRSRGWWILVPAGLTAVLIVAIVAPTFSQAKFAAKRSGYWKEAVSAAAPSYAAAAEVAEPAKSELALRDRAKMRSQAEDASTEKAAVRTGAPVKKKARVKPASGTRPGSERSVSGLEPSVNPLLGGLVRSSSDPNAALMAPNAVAAAKEANDVVVIEVDSIEEAERRIRELGSAVEAPQSKNRATTSSITSERRFVLSVPAKEAENVRKTIRNLASDKTGAVVEDGRTAQGSKREVLGGLAYSHAESGKPSATLNSAKADTGSQAKIVVIIRKKAAGTLQK